MINIMEGLRSRAFTDPARTLKRRSWGTGALAAAIITNEAPLKALEAVQDHPATPAVGLGIAGLLTLDLTVEAGVKLQRYIRGRIFIIDCTDRTPSK